ncbi:hypothetical protein IID19_01525 [Patescibacteria group bacterium]|nr:hypothetical protein [Patescibacteria group bacterium]
MANTEGLAFMVFFVNGSILVGFVLMLSRLQRVQSWWKRQSEKTGYIYGLALLFFHWAILPIQDVGDGLSFFDPESTYLTWWIYYWTDWGMRAGYLLVNLLVYAFMVVLGGVWIIHFIKNLGGFVVGLYVVFVMPFIYFISIWWISLPYRI